MDAEHHVNIETDEFHTIIATSLDGFLLTDLAGNIRESNDSYCQLVGYSRDQLIKMHLSSLAVDKSQAEVASQLEHITRMGALRFETKHRHNDGSNIDVEIGANSSPLHGGSIFMFIRDISRQKRLQPSLAEETIAASEKRYRELIEASHDWSWEIDATGTYTYVSHQVRDLLGYTSEEVLGKTPFHLMPEAEAARVRAIFEGFCLRKTPFYRLENANLHKDGRVVVLESSGIPIFDDQGNLLGFRGMDQNITERKLAENKLRENEERHRTILHTAIDGYWLTDLHGLILEVNDSYCRTSGYSKQELLAMRDLDLEAYTPVDITMRIQKIITQGHDFFETRHRRKNGDVFYVEISAQYLPFNGGQIAYFQRDISRRKHSETYRVLGQEILYLLNEKETIREAIQGIIHLVKSVTEADAMAIRLQDGDDYPYFSQEGFSVDFLLKENSLLLRTRDEGVCMDDSGHVCLECTCGLVLSGKTDPLNPLFTSGGSCWTNDSFPLLHVPADDDPRTNPRNECIHSNYASIALIPLRAKGQIVGLMQLNAHRKGCFTIQGIEALEGIAENIGEAMLRKQAEEQLRQERDRAQSYLDTVETIIVALDREGKITTINRKACQILGYREDELLGRWWFETCLPQPEGIEKIYPLFVRLMARGTEPFSTYWENLIITRSGELRNIAWHTAMLRNEKGQIIGGLIAGEDITERTQAETELLKLSQAVEQSPATITITDLKGNLEYVNPAFCKLTGYTEEEVLGKNPRFLKSGTTSAEEYRRLWETITGGGTWYGEFCNKKKNGEYYWERACIAPFTDKDGIIKNFVAIKEDISRLKQHESEMNRLEAQLMQAQKMESVGRLAGGVAHDFNNILMVIQSFSYIGLMESDPAQPISSYFQEIHRASERAASLTRQLLAFARKQAIAPKVIDLNEVVTGMMKMLQRLIGEDITLEWFPAETLWPIKMDPSQIDQILANLCVNAKDAIDNIGTIIIKTDNCSFDEKFCAAHTYVKQGEYVLLSISDNGYGMDKSTLSNIFEPFFTTKGLGKGTGLGLATTYGIVKQNDGFIDVTSELNGGTTFRIYLPRYLEDDRQPYTGEPERTNPRGHETILVVEDDASILGITTRFLTSQGYTVLAANTPGDAMCLAHENNSTIHLVVTDVIMPEMNGRDLSDKLYSLSPHLKCLFMSGYTADIIARHGVLENGVHFIQKPFQLPDLAVKIREILDLE